MRKYFCRDDHRKDEHIYETNKNNRFVLGTMGVKTLIAIGVNPSIATPDNYDQTIKKLAVFSRLFYFDSWIMLNIYPQIKTEFNELPDIYDQNVNLENIDKINKIIKLHYNKNSKIIAAWGDLIEEKAYLFQLLKNIVDEINGLDLEWFRIGKLTLQNHPRHLSRIGYDEKLHKFNLRYYYDSKLND